MIQSGCFSYNSLLGLTISGSIQMPNFTPCFSASLTKTPIPLGSLVLLGSQSPREDLSLFRGYLLANQPSSSKKRSTPNFLVSLIIPFNFSSLKSKKVVSQLLSSVMRG